MKLNGITIKNAFAIKWQEILHIAEDSEKHFLDVKKDLGSVTEFQLSFIKDEEVKSREDFYKM